MTAPTNSNPLQINFNNLLKDYPEVEEFCTEIRRGTFTRKILAEMNKVQKTLNEGQSITIRSLAKKFKKIVTAVDHNEDRLSVANKVTEFLKIFQTLANPDSPTPIQQMGPFLENLQNNGALNEPSDGTFLRLKFLLSSFNPSPELQTKIIKAKEELHEYMELTRDGLLSLKNPENFVKVIKLILDNNLLNEQELSALKNHPVPEIFLRSLLLTKWDGEKIEKSKVLGLIDLYRRNIMTRNPHHHLLYGILGINDDWSAFIEKYSDSLQILAMIFRAKNPKAQCEIWDQIITSKDQEIKFLTLLEDVDIEFFITNYQQHHKKNPIANVLEKYRNDPHAIAVIYRSANEEWVDIWDNYITPKNLEIEFLFYMDSPGAIQSLIFSKDVLPPKSKRLKALIDKYKGNGIALGILSKICNNKQLMEIYDDLIVPNNLESVFFLKTADTTRLRISGILAKRSKGGFAQTREKKLQKKYKKI